ncbi:MAG: hypothetical protein HYS12_27720 [Planctomycetes bacterium]|nr:hypothetical protein [Planctomycetota bacterium]
MTRLTCVFLVLLRLAIGWHFLFEGVEKLKSDAWSSEAYLRESTGPLAPVFHRIAGDAVADRLTPKPIPADIDTGKTELDAYFPPALEKEWQAWYDRFVSRYKLDDKQKEEAQKRFQQRRAQAVRWMLRGKVAVPPLSPYGPAEPIERTVPEWLETYQAKLVEAEHLENTELRKSKGSGYERQVADKVRDLKDEANRIRAALRRDLNKQTKDMREALGDLLTDEQWERDGPLSTSMSPGPLKWGLLGWADFLVAWGLTIIGALLLLGLFSRTACVAGALLVLSFYLAMPPWPGLPENPKAEGHYLIVNKNIIEMFALLVLATTASGKWLGLDRLFRFLNRKNYRKPGPQHKPEAPARTV